MKSDKIFFAVVAITFVVSLVAAGLVYYSVSNLFTKISGYVTTGEVNLTVETLAQINFTKDQVNFRSGRVNSDTTAASLITTSRPTGNVTGGNWTNQTGLFVENIGNVNVTLNLTGTKTAAQFIGGTNPVFQWNVSTGDGGEASSCGNKSGKFGATGSALGGLNLNILHNVNTTVGDSMKCFVLRFENANDRIRIDFNLTVPQDSSSGALGDIITATAYADNPTGDG